MGLTSDAWIAGLYGLILLLAAVGQYLNRPKRERKRDPVVTAIGLGWLEKEQTERFLHSVERQAVAQERIAEAVETLADKRSADMAESLEDLAGKVDQLLKVRRRT